MPDRPRRGTELEFAASVGAQTPDPDLSNNVDQLSVAIRKR
ncbi:hypothetical protein [Lysobacter sp.]|nr:hypothetical protein [Lysobacter sp.]HZX77941.1 hypothetical protein [Lysobacter sp.]